MYVGKVSAYIELLRGRMSEFGVSFAAAGGPRLTTPGLLLTPHFTCYPLTSIMSRDNPFLP